jgi:hypothetical protein
MTKAQLTEVPSLVPHDQRGAERAALLIRTAKLICQSGEYVCVVRDVSETGVKLHLFHALPPETFVFLETANGEIYPMENKWHRGDEAGFRFVQPIDVDTFIEEPNAFPRRPIRLRIEAHGRLFSEGRSAPVILRDLSQGGARIETTTWLALQQTVRLVIEGLPERFGQVRWRNRYDHGLAFDQSFRLDELAELAQKLQPFAPQPAVASAPTLTSVETPELRPIRANG